MFNKARRMITQEINKTAKSNILRRLENDRSDSHIISVPKFNELIEREAELLKGNSISFATDIALVLVLSILINILLNQ